VYNFGITHKVILVILFRAENFLRGLPLGQKLSLLSLLFFLSYPCYSECWQKVILVIRSFGKNIAAIALIFLSYPCCLVGFLQIAKLAIFGVNIGFYGVGLRGGGVSYPCYPCYSF